jgi:hypothetical protein
MNIIAKALALAAAAALIGAATPAPRAPAPPAAGPPGAAALVRDLYSHYPAPADGPYLHWEGRDGDRYLDPTLRALYRQAYGLSEGEVVSGMDADYFCSCQDDSGMRWTLTSLRAVDTTHATAVVSVRFAYPGGTVTRVTLHLVKLAQGWRVSNVTTADGGNWLNDLRQGIREAHGGH